jgi:predicted nucleotidyltransferase
MSDDVQKNILATIIYYDVLNFPLTSFEVWKYLLAENSCSLGDIVEALENDELKNSIEEFRGFYFLKGRKNLVERRIQNDKNSIEKFEIAEKEARWLKYVPFVRTIALTGTLAMKNCEKNSDIDFFVVLEKGRIFTGRLLATAMVHFLGKRRYGKKIKNRICLNYFTTTGSLEIQRQDLFAANEYSFIYPIFDSLVIPMQTGIQEFNDSGFSTGSRVKPGMTKKSVFSEFCEANFTWIKKIKPNWEIPELKPAKYFVEYSKISNAIQNILESLINALWGDKIESWQKRRQIARIERNPLTQKPGAYIEYTDENLIFLPEPQSVRIEEEWQRRLKS